MKVILKLRAAVTGVGYRPMNAPCKRHVQRAGTTRACWHLWRCASVPSEWLPNIERPYIIHKESCTTLPVQLTLEVVHTVVHVFINFHGSWWKLQCNFVEDFLEVYGKFHSGWKWKQRPSTGDLHSYSVEASKSFLIPLLTSTYFHEIPIRLLNSNNSPPTSIYFHYYELP